MSSNSTSGTNEIKDLVIKYLGSDVYDSSELDSMFVNGSINLRECISQINIYPKLIDFLEEYLMTCNDINQVNSYGWTTLHYACSLQMKKGIKKIIKLLIDVGADVNSVTNHGYSPLHLAVIWYKLESPNTKKNIELLIQAGADVFNLLDSNNLTPIDYFPEELIEYCQIDKNTQTIGIKSGNLTKVAKK